ncbi:MAG: hypothetical protein GC151_19410 [Betaproteobacteria bacterium]|nr:hypothetical protein [Betaproteobacteria bacterium]
MGIRANVAPVLAALGCARALAGEPALPPPGSPDDGSVSAPRYTCTDSPRGRICTRREAPGTTLHGVPVLSVVIRVQDGRVVADEARVPETSFTAALASFRHRFGTGEDRTETLRAGMSGEFRNVMRVWRHEGRAWVLEQFCGRIDTSCVRWMTPAALDALLAQRASETTRGVRDL